MKSTQKYAIKHITKLKPLTIMQDVSPEHILSLVEAKVVAGLLNFSLVCCGLVFACNDLIP